MILADAHVHIHHCYDLDQTLNSALINFTRSAGRPAGHGHDYVLLLAEGEGDDCFERLRRLCDLDRARDGNLWRFYKTGEPCSLRAGSEEGRELFILAGRQIVTREKLEVLALMSDKSFSDGSAVREVIRRIQSEGAIPVLPWGFGKWIGGRGKIVSGLLRDPGTGEIFLGDNSARPGFWFRPSIFSFAESRGIKVLPGSDPLPFPSESWRPGSFGFMLHGSIDHDHPSRSLKYALSDPDARLEPYGTLEGVLPCFRNQLRMQLRKRMSSRKVVMP